MSRIMKINKPSLRVRYDLEEIGKKELADILARV